MAPQCGPQAPWFRCRVSASTARPRTGVNGTLFHWRRIQSWALGAPDHVVLLIMKLDDHFEILDIYELLKSKAGVSRKPCSIALAAAATN